MKKNERLNVNKIVREVSKHSGYNISEVEDFLNSFTAIFVEALQNECTIVLPLIGKFEVTQLKPRVITLGGKEVKASAKKKVRFSAPSSLKKVLNVSDSEPSDVVN